MEYVKILGTPSQSATTQTHELELSNGGKLFLLITLHSPEPSLTRIEAIRGAVNFLHHEISKEEFNFEAFKKSFGATLVVPQFEAVAAYVFEGVVYVYAVGKTQAFLQRSGKLLPLLSGASQVQSASGYIQESDLLVLITDAMLTLCPVVELSSYTANNRLAALEEDTATRIQESELHGECGVLFLSQKLEAPTHPDTLETMPQVEDAEESEPEVVNPEPDVTETETPVETLEEEIEDADLVSEQEPEETVVNEPTANTSFHQPVFVRNESIYEARGKSKKLAYVGVILIALLAVSIYFGNKARKSKAEAASVATVISQAQSALSEAKTISSVNKSRARDLIVGAREQVLEVHTEAVYPELSSIKDALTQSLGEVAGVYEVSPTIFSDLSLISQNTKASSLAISDGVINILSRDDKKVVTIELPGKRTETLGGASNLSVFSVGAYTKKSFVMAQDGIYTVATSATKVTDLPGDVSNLLFAAFAGNIYVVDRGANQIWRYAGDGTSFGEKKEWLSADTQVDFSKVKAMGIDGSIWMYSQTGKLTKFTLGNAQVVSFKGLPQTPGEQALFFTDSDSQSLYLLDQAAKSLFVFDKTGELQATYTDAGLATAEQFLVSESSKLMIYSVGSKLFSIPTKHIQ